MLLKQATLQAIRDGEITVQFRRWKRPTVKSGGTLLTAIGQLAIGSVERVERSDITAADASSAGYESLDGLLAALDRRAGEIYRIRLSVAGPDPREALRERVPDTEELAELVRRMERLDARATHGPWTRRTLRIIRGRPAERAAALARDVGMERDRFKTHVRKLKGLGLTESLEVGYRLSPRGEALLDHLDAGGAAPS